MIDWVRIENLGVIAAAELPLAPTFTVITGETGAGKTMVLTSLGLLLGGKTDPALVRAGADRALVEGSFGAPLAGPARTVAEEAGAAVEDGELIVARTVPARGRSRAHLGGRTVPQSVLAAAGEHLVTVHGQADQQRLRSPAHQRAALDAFGGADHAALLGAYRQAWGDAVRCREAMGEWEAGAASRDEEIDLLQARLARIDALAPQPGEDVALREEAERLGNVEELRQAAGRAHAALAGDEDTAVGPADALSLVEVARHALEPATAHDPALEAWVAQLADISAELGDVAAELGGYLAELESDPVRLQAVHERRAALAELTRRHGGDLDAVLAWAGRARERLAFLDGPADTGARLREALAAAEARLGESAAALSASRRGLAADLAQRVDAELTGLAMRGAHLTVALEPLPTPGPYGAEQVEMLLAAHPGAPARPLGQGASGGELSRVMLALEVVLAGEDADDGRRTFVFDEVDAGVGGKAAVEVGRRLARLAAHAQVVVVTHLAQVAAFADQHLVVAKEPGDGTDGVVTATDVRAVTGEERVRELARMLSGREESHTARKHAAELLEQADVRR